MEKEKWFEAIIVYALILLAFLFRYWHITSTAWTGDANSALLGVQYSFRSPFHFSDTGNYVGIAMGYLAGKGFYFPFNPPFLGFFLVGAFKLFGYDYPFILTIYAVIGSSALMFIFMIARDIFGRAEAILTTLLCSVSFTLIYITGALNTENIYLFLLALSLRSFLAIYRQSETSGYRLIAVSFAFGVFSAAAAMTRSEYLLILAVLFFYGLFRKQWSGMVKMKVVIAVAVGMLILIAPWAYRNYVFMTGFNNDVPQARLPVFIPLAYNGPLNFVEAHNPKANGSYSPSFMGTDNMLKIDLLDEKVLAIYRDGYAIGWDYIKNNPGKELKLIPAKLAVFIKGFANGFLLNNFPAGLSGTAANNADSFVPDSNILLPVGGLFFLVGVYAIYIRKDETKLKYLPLLPIGAVLFTTLTFYGLSRFAYPVLPYYYMIISVGAVHLFKKIKIEERFFSFSVACVISVLLLTGYFQSREISVFLSEAKGEKMISHKISFYRTIPKIVKK